MSASTQLPLFPTAESAQDRQGTHALSYPPTRLSTLPLCERPATRLQDFGPTTLSAIELLSLIIGGEHALITATQIFTHAGGLTQVATLALDELQTFHHVGAGTAARIKAACELGRRLFREERPPTRQVRSPADAAYLVMAEMSLLEQEEVRTILLDTKNGVRSIHTIYKGSLNRAVIRVGELFRQAIRENSAAIILVHNHPSSGDPTPSPEDVRVTEVVVEAGRLLNIDVIDHLVIGHQCYVSMRERGLGF